MRASERKLAEHRSIIDTLLLQNKGLVDLCSEKDRTIEYLLEKLNEESERRSRGMQEDARLRARLTKLRQLVRVGGFMVLFL